MRNLLKTIPSLLIFILFNSITFADICTDVEQETGFDLNPAECYVLEQVEKGEIAHFKDEHLEMSYWDEAKFQDRFSKIEDRTLAADFLVKLLTGALRSLNVNKNRVFIKAARVREYLNVSEDKIPFNITLDTLTPGVNFRSEATLPPYTFNHPDYRKTIFNFCFRFQQILGWY